MKARTAITLLIGLAALGSSAGAAKGPKGPKIPVGDDPSSKEGSPNLVLVEVSDFQ